jgi:hypothetical protein
MTNAIPFGERFDGSLTVIDEHLAATGVVLQQRPFHATVALLQHDILELRTDGGTTLYVQGDTSNVDWVVAPWWCCRGSGWN